MILKAKKRIEYFLQLFKLFFSQFYITESIPVGTEGYKSIIPIIAILSSPGLFIPLYWLIPIYTHINEFPTGGDIASLAPLGHRTKTGVHRPRAESQHVDLVVQKLDSQCFGKTGNIRFGGCIDCKIGNWQTAGK